MTLVSRAKAIRIFQGGKVRAVTLIGDTGHLRKIYVKTRKSGLLERQFPNSSADTSHGARQL